VAPSGDRLPVAALGFGVAAALSSWNPLSAPFAVVVGIAALVLGVRALRAAGRRRGVAIAAVAVAFVAVVAGAVVLALTAGVGRELGGTPVVQLPAGEEVSSELDRAAERTRAARERARAELDRLEPQPVSTPRDGRARGR
jgi:predicted PurR-regulated permease PerM